MQLQSAIKIYIQLNCGCFMCNIKSGLPVSLGKNDKAKIKWSWQISNAAYRVFGDLSVSALTDMGYTAVLCSFYEQSALSLDYCCSKWESEKRDDQSICAGSRPKLWRSPGECVFLRRPEETTPPFPILNLPLVSPLSHHNIVFISPLRLNPSLPVRCGKRHFENEIGYINSSAITLAIAFPLYSSSGTWLTSTHHPHISHKTQG